MNHHTLFIHHTNLGVKIYTSRIRDHLLQFLFHQSGSWVYI